MHRIDHETATSDHKFTEGNPTIPVPATVVTDDWLNAVQEELVAVITGAGLELEKSDNTQLWQAITTAVDNALPGLATTKNPGLVQIGDGLAITPQGLLSVLIASTSQAGLVKPRYGLKIGKDGSLDVDFGDMPTDKFEELLKSIRVPIWITGNKNFYVNGTTGSDTLDAGRGESAGKPFKTLNACLQYVSENYNLSRYTVTINVAAGDYGRENINLPSYQATTGKIVVQGVKGDCTAVRIGAQVLVYDRIYEVRDVTVQRSNVSSGIVGSIQAEAGSIDLVNVALDTRDITYGMGSYYPLYAVTGGHIRIWATNDPDHPAGVTIIGNGNTISGWAMVQTAGLLDFAADISITGGLVFEAAGVVVANHGTWLRSNSSMQNPGRIPELVISGSYTGRRYSVATNGIISTRVAGADYLPGDITGSVTSGGQYL